MIFGKYINKYYLKYSPILFLGILALLLVDYFQLEIPELYRMVINGANTGKVEYEGVIYDFDMDFLLERICMPIVPIIIIMFFGRFFWRVCFFGAAIKVAKKLRGEMFSRSKQLSVQFYHKNKVGNLGSRVSFRLVRTVKHPRTVNYPRTRRVKTGHREDTEEQADQWCRFIFAAPLLPLR